MSLFYWQEFRSLIGNILHGMPRNGEKKLEAYNFLIFFLHIEILGRSADNLQTNLVNLQYLN